MATCKVGTPNDSQMSDCLINNNNNNLCSTIADIKTSLPATKGDECMFDEGILHQIRMSANIPSLPCGYRIRSLRLGDYHKGYLELLSQLTSVGTVSEEQFVYRFRTMQQSDPKSYYVVVVEEVESGKIVGSATLVIEWKFIHETGCRGRTEDVVVHSRARGLQLGKILNYYLVQLACHIGVYKMSLECKDSLVTFYEQFGFKKDIGNNFLVQRFDNVQ
ncbi:hypothetical protein AB6A40_008650 [Gnathostoma spinigerum]|uniref:Glucosamine 6-phosphate N-acetyltransferase n=1 Tax=Gnathostoma spinigerum TaxID=75299 RepID=A0ABD6EWS1_9BILA